MSKTTLRNYIWLVDTINRAGNISYDEINAKWLHSQYTDGKEIPLRTFHNWRKKVEDIFDINIECNKSTNKYYIENAEDLNSNSICTWLLSTFTVSNLLHERAVIKERVLLENVPSGQKFLDIVLESIKENVQLQVVYKSYHEENGTTFNLSPYFIKLFKQRWYLIGKSDKIRTYALDRIMSIEKTDEHFSLPVNFNAENYFHDCYGIVNDENLKPEIIRLKVSAKQSNYIRDLPFHHSQKETEKNDEFSIFENWLKPTYDFIQEIMKYGSQIEVLSPVDFRNELSSMIEEALDAYPI